MEYLKGAYLGKQSGHLFRSLFLLSGPMGNKDTPNKTFVGFHV